MALVIRITGYKRLAEPDTLDRIEGGHFHGMTEQQAYEAGRGVWTLGPKADDERFAMIVGGGKGTGTVLAVIEIDGIHDDRSLPNKRYFTGSVLAAGHPMRDTYLGQPDPSNSTSQNSVAYARNLPEEQQFLTRSCRCGCGTQVRKAFAAGHDQRAIHHMIAKHFGGSTVTFLDWIENNPPSEKQPADGHEPPDDTERRQAQVAAPD